MKALVPERDVVHRPLPLRGHRQRLAEGAEDDVDDPRRRLGVAGDDGRGRAGVDEAALGRGHRHRRERAARRGQIRLGQAADDEVAGGARDRERAVEVVRVLRRRAREVDVDLVAGDLDRAADRELAVDRFDDVLRRPAPVGERGDRGANHPLRVRVQLVHRRGDALASAARAQLVDPPLGEPVRGHLRPQVAAALVRVARVRDEERQRPRR